MGDPVVQESKIEGPAHSADFSSIDLEGPSHKLSQIVRQELSFLYNNNLQKLTEGAGVDYEEVKALKDSLYLPDASLKTLIETRNSLIALFGASTIKVFNLSSHLRILTGASEEDYFPKIKVESIDKVDLLNNTIFGTMNGKTFSISLTDLGAIKSIGIEGLKIEGPHLDFDSIPKYFIQVLQDAAPYAAGNELRVGHQNFPPIPGVIMGTQDLFIDSAGRGFFRFSNGEQDVTLMSSNLMNLDALKELNRFSKQKSFKLNQTLETIKSLSGEDLFSVLRKFRNPSVLFSKSLPGEKNLPQLIEGLKEKGVSQSLIDDLKIGISEAKNFQIMLSRVFNQAMDAEFIPISDENNILSLRIDKNNPSEDNEMFEQYKGFYNESFRVTISKKSEIEIRSFGSDFGLVTTRDKGYLPDPNKSGEQALTEEIFFFINDFGPDKVISIFKDLVLHDELYYEVNSQGKKISDFNTFKKNHPINAEARYYQYFQEHVPQDQQLSMLRKMLDHSQSSVEIIRNIDLNIREIQGAVSNFRSNIGLDIKVDPYQSIKHRETRSLISSEEIASTIKSLQEEAILYPPGFF